jgi:PucR-like helix-turn-helix protein
VASSVDPTPWSRLPKELGQILRPEVPATVEAIASGLTASVPGFSEISDEKFVRDLRDGVRVGLERFLELVGTHEPVLTTAVREVFQGLGAGEARDGREPEYLLLALRLSSRLFLRRTVDVLSAVHRLEPDEIVDLSDAINACADELAAAGADGFARQLCERAGETDRRRRQLGELLLRGGAPSAVTEAAQALNWPLSLPILPVLLPEDQARSARFRFGTEGIVVERPGDVVLLLHESPRTGRAHLAERLQGRTAVVGPALGWPRIPTGLHLAELVAGPAGPHPTGSPDGVIFVEDHLADLALRGAPAALACLAELRLSAFAPVAEVQRRRLLQTLHSWLQHWGSRFDVADDLFVHPQTVSYRLRQIRELLGADLERAQVRFELMLVLAHEFGGPDRCAMRTDPDSVDTAR